MKEIAVIGAGTMGNGIAHVFAQSGFNVTLIDVQDAALERALSTIGRNLDRLIKKEKITEADKEATLGRIRTSTTMDEGVANVNLIVEAATSARPQIEHLQGHGRRGTRRLHLATNTSSFIPKSAATAAPRAGHWHALHEPGAGHEIGGSHPRIRHQRAFCCDGAFQGAGQGPRG